MSVVICPLRGQQVAQESVAIDSHRKKENKSVRPKVNVKIWLPEVVRKEIGRTRRDGNWEKRMNVCVPV